MVEVVDPVVSLVPVRQEIRMYLAVVAAALAVTGAAMVVAAAMAVPVAVVPVMV